jgi:hypothetical protein
MKKVHYVALLCLPLLCHAQTFQVRIAENNYPVEFADTNLSVTNQQRIASDLTTVFSLISSFEDLEIDEVETGVFQLDEELMFTAGEENHILILDNNNTKSIRVKKELSDKYQQTFILADGYSNAVQQASEFVTLLNSTNLLTQSSVQVIRQICHISPQAETEDPPSNEVAKIQKLATDFLQWRYLGFCVLNFSKEQVEVLGETGEKPVILLFTVGKSDPSKRFAMPIVFHNGKWRFGGRVSTLENP